MAEANHFEWMGGLDPCLWRLFNADTQIRSLPQWDHDLLHCRLGKTGYPISTKDRPGMQQCVATQGVSRLDNSYLKRELLLFLIYSV